MQLGMVNLAWVVARQIYYLCCDSSQERNGKATRTFIVSIYLKPHNPPPANTGKKTVRHSFLLVFLLYDYSFHLHQIFRHQPGETKTIRFNTLAYLLLFWVAL
jgi:hypothetical protein